MVSSFGFSLRVAVIGTALTGRRRECVTAASPCPVTAASPLPACVYPHSIWGKERANEGLLCLGWLAIVGMAEAEYALVKANAAIFWAFHLVCRCTCVCVCVQRQHCVMATTFRA
jgi:hypothetical protein